VLGGRAIWYGPTDGLIWFARLNGVSLLIVGILGWPLRTTPPLEWFDLSTAENSIHILLSGLLIYAGFVRPDPELARRAIALVGLVAFLLGAVMGFTPAPGELVDAGLLATDWGVVHQIAHLLVAVLFGGVWLAAGRERKRLVAEAASPPAALGLAGSAGSGA
jgi:hypothetical protein